MKNEKLRGCAAYYVNFLSSTDSSLLREGFNQFLRSNIYQVRTESFRNYSLFIFNSSLSFAVQNLSFSVPAISAYALFGQTDCFDKTFYALVTEGCELEFLADDFAQLLASFG